MSKDEKVLCAKNEQLKVLARNISGMTGKFAVNPGLPHPAFYPANLFPLGWIVRHLRNPNADLNFEATGPIFSPRSHCETDQSLRQICSYSIFNAAGMHVSYTRSKQGAEARLYGDRSLGFGGHVSEPDFDGQEINEETILAAVKRENREEIVFSDRATYHYMGMLLVNESNNPVHLVHAGIVYEVRLPANDLYIAPKEDCIADLLVSKRSYMLERYPYEKFEKWSQILLDVTGEPRQTFF